MADFEVEIEQNIGDEPPADVVMGGDEVVMADTGTTTTNVEHGENGLPFQEEEEEEEVIPARVTFVDHLKSPIVELLIGQGKEQTLLTAHQALLVQSPFFEDACAEFSDNALV